MNGLQIIKSLGKRKLTTGLMIFQLTACILCFLILCQFIRYYNTRYKLYNRIIDEKHTIVADESVYDQDLKIKKKALDEIFKLKDSGIISDILVISKMNNTFKVKDKYYPCYQLSKNMVDRLNISIEKGRSFTEEELDAFTYREEIPVIIGSRLGNYLKIGDTISSNYHYADENGEYSYKRTLKVIGIAKPGSMVTLESSSNVAGIFINDYGIYSSLGVWKYYLKDNSPDKFLIEGTIKNSKEYNLDYELQNNLIISNNSDYLDAILHNEFQILVRQDRDTEAVKEILNNICRQNNSRTRFETLEHSNEIMNSLFSQGILAILTFTIILFIFSITGIIGTTLYSINKRRKEFGIRLSQGSTLNKITYLIVSEILFENIAALILAVTPFKLLELYINKNFSTNVEYTYLISFDFNILAMVFGLILSSSLITSIIPIKKIMKLDVVELIRGK